MRLIVLSAACCVASLSCGGLLLAAFGPELPSWLMALALALCSGLALACGFGLYNPKVPDWLRQRPVLGAICVAIGVGAMFIPVNFVVSAFLLGCGTRLVWVSACELGRMPGSSCQVFPPRMPASKIAFEPDRGIEAWQTIRPGSLPAEKKP